MITKNDIIKMAKHIARRDRGVPDRHLMHPVRDWVIGLSISSVLFVIGAAYFGNLFFVELHYTVSTQPVDTNSVVYKQVSAAAALKQYEERKKHFDELVADQHPLPVAASTNQPAPTAASSTTASSTNTTASSTTTGQ